MTGSDDTDTDVFIRPEPEKRVERRGEAHAFHAADIEIAAITHVGIARVNNEDQFAVVKRTRRSELLASSLPPDALPMTVEQAYLMMVADGLGGEVFGELASQTALQVVQRVANKLTSWIMHPDDGLSDELQERIDVYLQAIQHALAEQARQKPELTGMATTLTVAYCFGRHAIIVNIGDSRAYLVRGGKAVQVTSDHTVAEEMRRQGRDPSSVMYRNVLTRCLSTSPEPVNADLFQLELEDGDRLLLCTDGLSDMVSHQEIEQLLAAQATAKDACERLVAAALDAGGHDNITMVLSGHRFPQLAE